MNDLPLVSMGVHCTHCWHRIELCICPASHPWWFDSDDSLSPIMPLRVSGSITVTIPRENASRILDIMLGRRRPVRWAGHRGRNRRKGYRHGHR